MFIKCPKCVTRMHYTGEHHPTCTPQRYYSCENKHMVLVYGQPEEDVDWGDMSISNRWREAIRAGTVEIDKYEMIGKLHWKSLD